MRWLGYVAAFCVLVFLIYASTIVVMAFVEPIRINDPNNASYYKAKNRILQFDPEFGFINRKKYSFVRDVKFRSHAVNFAVHYDKNGYRVDQPDITADVNVDVLICGESSAWGYGLNNEKTVGPQLERIADIKVLNVSVPGGTGGSCLAQFMRAAELGRAKYAVYYFWQEHLASNKSPCANTGTPACFPLNHIRKKPNGSLYLDVVEASEAVGYDRFNRFFLQARTDGDSEGTFLTDIYWKHRSTVLRAQDYMRKRIEAMPDEREANVYLVETMRDAVLQHGITLIVMYVPFYFEGRIAKTPGWVVPGLNLSAVPSFSLEAPFRQAVAENKTFWFVDDSHLNEEGHALIARSLARWGAEHGFWRLRPSL